MNSRTPIDADWRTIIKLNEIPETKLRHSGRSFVRSVTRQFQECEKLTERQWNAVRSFIEQYVMEHGSDPKKPEEI